MRIYFPLAALTLCFSACSKQNASSPTTPAPVAIFSVAANTIGSTIVMGTYDQLLLIDRSTNASSWQWDFGNGSTSTEKNPVLYYPIAGTYTLTETVKDQYGRTSKASYPIRVFDRVIKQVNITNLFENIRPVGHSLDHASVWAVIKLAPNNTTYPFPTSPDQSYNAPIIYQSPVVTVDSLHLPITFNVPGKLMVDFPALACISITGYGYTGVGYGLELYARDNTGTYLLSSSYQYFYDAQSGGITNPVADILKNTFVMRYANISVNCDYE